MRLLEDAGYANVGKTNLHEFAYGTTSENPHFGDVPNPLLPGRVAGGSSGGSAAALTAGLADAALGTDSGGSIRIPAACCGVIGFKPTYGLVPLDGCWPLAASYDHAGPLALRRRRLRADAGAARPGLRAARARSREELEVGVAWTELADPLVRGAGGGRRRPLPAAAHRRAAARPGRDLRRSSCARWPTSTASSSPRTQTRYGEDVRLKVEKCLAVRDAEVEPRCPGAEYREHAAEALDGLDLVLTPTLPFVAPPLQRGVAPGDLDVRESLIRFTYPFNALGWPALALPCGPAEDGLPASRPARRPAGDDALVLAAGRLLAAAA